MLDMGEGDKRAAVARHETQETPKEAGQLQRPEFSKALSGNESRKDKSSRMCIAQFNRGLEDGSFHLVDDAQLENHKNGHGFTMPGGEDPPGGPVVVAAGSGASSGPGGHRLPYG